MAECGYSSLWSSFSFVCQLLGGILSTPGLDPLEQESSIPGLGRVAPPEWVGFVTCGVRPLVTGNPATILVSWTEIWYPLTHLIEAELLSWAMNKTIMVTTRIHLKDILKQRIHYNARLHGKLFLPVAGMWLYMKVNSGNHSHTTVVFFISPQNL